MVEAAQEKHACTKEASSAKKPVKFIAKAAPGMLGLTTVHHDYIQGRLNRLRALQAQDEWLAAMAEGGMRYTDDGLQIDLDGPNLPNGSKPFATVPLASIRFYDVIKKDGAQIYEIIIKTPVFAGGVWSMSETREEFSAISKWVQNNLGTSADAIAQKLMSQDQTKVLDFLAQARQQVQREIAETVQAMPKLACGDACVSTLGALSSRAFPKLPSSPSLMV